MKTIVIHFQIRGSTNKAIAFITTKSNFESNFPQVLNGVLGCHAELKYMIEL